LFIFFNYLEIKLINIICQVILMGYIVYLFINNRKINLLIAYLLSIVCIYPNVIALSFQYSTMFYIFNLGIILVLSKNELLRKNNNYLYLFLIIGMLTCCFDFLTYPLTGCVLPLIVYLLLNYKKTFIENMKIIILSGLFWRLGYGGMWISKWGLGSLILRKNLLESAIDGIMFRTSSSDANFIGRFGVIMENYSHFKFLFFKCFLILMIYIFIRWFVLKMIRLERKNAIKYIPVLLLGLLPFVWYIVLNNHSDIHSWFTYRNLVIFSFSLFSYLLLLFEDINKKGY